MRVLQGRRGNRLILVKKVCFCRKNKRFRREVKCEFLTAIGWDKNCCRKGKQTFSGKNGEQSGNQSFKTRVSSLSNKGFQIRRYQFVCFRPPPQAATHPFSRSSASLAGTGKWRASSLRQVEIKCCVHVRRQYYHNLATSLPQSYRNLITILPPPPPPQEQEQEQKQGQEQ